MTGGRFVKRPYRGVRADEGIGPYAGRNGLPHRRGRRLPYKIVTRA